MVPRGARRRARRARQRYYLPAGSRRRRRPAAQQLESVFGGTGMDPRSAGRREWYLHLFAPGQPDLNWDHAEVRARVRGHPGVLVRPGVDGFRIDVAHGWSRSRTARRGRRRRQPGTRVRHRAGHPAWDRTACTRCTEGGGRSPTAIRRTRIFVAEAWVHSTERLARYLRPDELHTAFQFDFLRTPWRAELLRAVIDDAIGAAARSGRRRPGCCPTMT